MDETKRDVALVRATDEALVARDMLRTLASITADLPDGIDAEAVSGLAELLRLIDGRFSDLLALL